MGFNDLEERTILNQYETERGRLSVEERRLSKSIIRAIKAESNFNGEEGFAALHSVKNAMELFFENLNIEDIYTIEDDDYIKELRDKILNGFSVVAKQTNGFVENTRRNLSEALREDFDSVILFFIILIGGYGNITTELDLSLALYHYGFFEGPPKKRTLNYIKRLCTTEIRAREAVIRYFMDVLGIQRRLNLIHRMARREFVILLETLLKYYFKGRLAKIRGHKAEYILAHRLNKLRIPFEPRERLSAIITADISVPFIINRKVNFVIPDVENIKAIIQCMYYTSVTGGVCKKALAQMRETKRHITNHNSSTDSNVLLIAFTDGKGWIGMRGDLARVFVIADHVIQLNTINALPGILSVN